MMFPEEAEYSIKIIRATFRLLMSRMRARTMCAIGEEVMQVWGVWEDMSVRK